MRIAVIGLGLIGGSLALALRQSSGPKAEIIGYARNKQVAERATAMNAVDCTSDSIPGAVEHAQIVVVCTPVIATQEVFEAIAPHVGPDCLVTDTASTKQQVMEWAERSFSHKNVPFVGGHPMAGKEKSGIDAAEAKLLDGCTYCLTPATWTPPAYVDRAVELARQVKSVPLFIDARKHDYLAAAISHLPAILSAALVQTTMDSPDWPLMSRLAATGYRDMTRLASGNPEINSGIFETNRESLVRWIDEFSDSLSRLRASILDDSRHLDSLLGQICKERDDWLRQRPNLTQGTGNSK